MSQKTTSGGKEGHKVNAVGGRAGGAKVKSQSRQAPKKTMARVTEADLRRQQNISPEDVLRLDRATEGKGLVCSLPMCICVAKGRGHLSAGYLCAPDANVYSIEFVRFKIRDLDTGTDLFEVTKAEDEEEEENEQKARVEEGGMHLQREPARYVKYQFPPQFLKLKRIGAL